MKKQHVFTALFAVIVLAVMVGGIAVCEHESSEALKEQGLMGDDGEIGSNYGKRYSGFRWSENKPCTRFCGYNDSLQPIVPMYIDTHGFVTGDTFDLPREKPAGEIRIFIIGGSAVFGSLQSRSEIPDSSYPAGVACYESGIAGRLQTILRNNHPGMAIKVINAGVFEYRFNQDFAYYYEKIHDFSPDLIINMDGCNDQWQGVSLIDPYADVAAYNKKYLDLETLQRIHHWTRSSTLTLLASRSIMLNQEDDVAASAEAFKKRYGAARYREIMKNDAAPEERDYPADSFARLRPFMEKSLAKQFWLISSYENQLAHDGVRSLFCLQPTLSRQGKQKDLHPIERQLFTALHEDHPERRLLFDSFVVATMNLPQGLWEAIAPMGDAKCFMRHYYYKHFVDDFISPTLDSIVTSAGGRYVDMNARIDTMGSGTLFYADYCHLTMQANDYIARVFAKEVEEMVFPKE